MSSVPAAEAEDRNGVILASIVEGVVQSDLFHRLSISPRVVSRLVKDLERKGLVIRKELVWKGRHSYWLKLSPRASEEALSDYLTTKRWVKPGPNLDFVAPDITARTRQVVDLRLAGKTIRQIAGALGISPKTVEIHLSFARDPRRYYRKAAQVRKREDTGAERAVPRLRQLVRERGYVISDDPMFDYHFVHAAEMLELSDGLKFIRFPDKRHILGSLAGKSVLYLDPWKLAGQIADRVRHEVLDDFEDWHKKHFGRPSNPHSHKSGLTAVLNDVCRGDKVLVSAVSENLAPSYEELRNRGVRIP